MEASLTVKALRAGGLPDPVTGTVAPTTSSPSQSQSLDRGSDVVHCGLREVLRGVLYLNLPNPTLEIWEKRERDTRTKRNKRLHRTQHLSTLINVLSHSPIFLTVFKVTVVAVLLWIVVRETTNGSRILWPDTVPLLVHLPHWNCL